MPNSLLPWSIEESNNHFVFYLSGGLGLIYFLCLAISNALARKEPSIIVLPVAEEETNETFYEYLVTIRTSLFPGSGCPSDVRVFLQLCGNSRDSPYFFLKSNRSDRKILKRACSDIFLIRTKAPIGQVHMVKFIFAGRKDIFWNLWEVEIYRPEFGDRFIVPVQFSNLEEIEASEEKPVVFLQKSLCGKLWRDVFTYHRCLSPFNNPIHFGAFTPIVNVLLLFLTLVTLQVGSLIVYIITKDLAVDSSVFNVDYHRVLYCFAVLVVGTIFTSILEFIIRNITSGKKTQSTELIQGKVDILNIIADAITNTHKCVEKMSHDQHDKCTCRYITCVEQQQIQTNSRSPILDVKLHFSLSKPKEHLINNLTEDNSSFTSSNISNHLRNSDSITLTLRDNETPLMDLESAKMLIQYQNPANVITNAYSQGEALIQKEEDIKSVQMQMLFDPHSSSQEKRYSSSVRYIEKDAANIQTKISRTIQSVEKDLPSPNLSYPSTNCFRFPQGIESFETFRPKPVFNNETFSQDWDESCSNKNDLDVNTTLQKATPVNHELLHNDSDNNFPNLGEISRNTNALGSSEESISKQNSIVVKTDATDGIVSEDNGEVYKIAVYFSEENMSSHPNERTLPKLFTADERNLPHTSTDNRTLSDDIIMNVESKKRTTTPKEIVPFYFSPDDNGMESHSLDETIHSSTQHKSRCDLSEDLNVYVLDCTKLSKKTSSKVKFASRRHRKKEEHEPLVVGDKKSDKQARENRHIFEDLKNFSMPAMMEDFTEEERYHPKLHLSDTSMIKHPPADNTSYYSIDDRATVLCKPSMTAILEGYDISLGKQFSQEMPGTIVNNCVVTASQIFNERNADHMLELKGMAYRLVYEAAKMLKSVRDKICRGSIMCLEDVITKVRELNCDLVRHLWLRLMHKQQQRRREQQQSASEKLETKLSENMPDLQVTYEKIFPNIYENSVSIMKSVITELIKHLDSYHKITGAVVEIIAYKVIKCVDSAASACLDSSDEKAEDKCLDVMDLTVLSEVVIKNVVGLILKKYDAASKGQDFTTLMESLSTSILNNAGEELCKESHECILVWNMCYSIITDAKQELWQEYQDPFYIYANLLAHQTMLESLKHHLNKHRKYRLAHCSLHSLKELIKVLSHHWHRQGFHSSVQAEYAFAQVLVCWFVSERLEKSPRYPLWNGHYMEKMEHVLAVKLKENAELLVDEYLKNLNETWNSTEKGLGEKQYNINMDLIDDINVQVELTMYRLEDSAEIIVEKVLQDEEMNYVASRLVTQVVSDAVCKFFRIESQALSYTDYDTDEDFLNIEDITELKKELAPLCGYLKHIQYSQKTKAKEMADEYFDLNRSRHKSYAMVNLQNVVDSYYIVDKLDQCHLSKSVLFQYEFEASQESTKSLSPSHKPIIILIAICLTVLSLIYVSVVGGQLDTLQVQEWAIHFIITIIQFIVLLEPVKALLIGWYEYQITHKLNVINQQIYPELNC